MLNAKLNTFEVGHTDTRMSSRSQQSSDVEQDDSQIDFSEIREWTKEDFANSKRGLFYRPKSKLAQSTEKY